MRDLTLLRGIRVAGRMSRGYLACYNLDLLSRSHLVSGADVGADECLRLHAQYDNRE
jgi:hypothetical protein